MPAELDRYAKHFISLRYWLLGKGYYTALDALEYGAKIHTGTRKDRITPEYAHQLYTGHYVRSLAASLECPEETLAAMCLHDVCEDYAIGREEIETRYGGVIAQAVWLLTKKFRGYAKPPAEYYREIAENKIASIAKGADRIHNIQTMLGVFNLAKQKEYIQETQTYTLPALKEARRRFPRQEPAYENIKHMLNSQIELLQAVQAAQTATGRKRQSG